MRIRTVVIGCSDLRGTESFYASVLGLPTRAANGEVRVTVGWTELVLSLSDSEVGGQHVAFLIPSSRFAEAKAWLLDRVPLLSTEDGDEFECPPTWNAHSLYFRGPDDNVLELIAHRGLHPESAAGFGAASILGVSEVGVPVADVPDFTREALTRLGLGRFGTGSADFQPVGTKEGLLIAVTQGRNWLPTQTSAAPRPMHVSIDGATPGSWSTAEGFTLHSL